jgi:hypothetical protein
MAGGVMRKCPRCGEPDDGLFNKQMDTHGPFCAFCGWPERLNLTGARQALPLGYRCEAHEGDVADGRCVCCEVAQVASLTAENTALRAYVGLVVQYMEKGEPWWHDKGLKEQGRALLDTQAPAGGGKEAGDGQD